MVLFLCLLFGQFLKGASVLSRIEQLAKKWNHGRDPDGKIYSTAEVAEICGLSSPQAVSRMIDRGVIKGFSYSKPHWRGSRKGVFPQDLIRYMEEHNLPLNRIPEDDVDGQKAILQNLIKQLRLRGEDAKRRGEIFRHFGMSVDKVIAIFASSQSMRECLGSKSDMQGCTRNFSWAKFLRLLADTIEQHTRVCKANAKKNVA